MTACSQRWLLVGHKCLHVVNHTKKQRNISYRCPLCDGTRRRRQSACSKHQKRAKEIEHGNNLIIALTHLKSEVANLTRAEFRNVLGA